MAKHGIILFLVFLGIAQHTFSQADARDRRDLGQLWIDGKLEQFDVTRLKANSGIKIVPVGGTLIPIDRPRTVFISGLNILGNDSDNVVSIGTDRLNKKTSSMTDFVKAMVRNSPNADQLLIAYSQGGLRAIGYANVMERLGFGNRIKGIIFIDSPVRGFPALSWGKGRLVQTVDSIEQSVTSRLDSLSSALTAVSRDPLLAYGNLWGTLLGHAFIDYAEITTVNGRAVAASDQIKKSSGTYLLDNVAGMSDQAVSDLTPGGAFARNYLGIDSGAQYLDWSRESKRSYGESKVRFYDPKTVNLLDLENTGDSSFRSYNPHELISYHTWGKGVKTVPYFDSLVFFEKNFGLCGLGGATEYDETKAFADSVDLNMPIRCRPVLPSNVRLAFFVGVNNDPLSMFPDLKLNRDKLVSEMDTKCADLDSYSGLPKLETSLGILYVALDELRSLLRKEDGRYIQVSGAALGDLSNDGFIPRYAQYRAIEEIGGSPMLPGGYSGYIYEYKLSHDSPDPELSCLKSSKIWGTGAFGKGIPRYSGSLSMSSEPRIPLILENLARDGSLLPSERRFWSSVGSQVMKW